MGPRAEHLLRYGEASSADPLDWSWVDHQLAAAGTYWVVAPSSAFPHPRPSWGLWHGDRLHLSIGSKVLLRQMGAATPVTAHLDSGTDVVIVEGVVDGSTHDPDFVAAYNVKYDWDYTVEAYGPLTTMAPRTVISWRSSGWAGRGGFEQAGRWRFDG